MDLLQAIFLNIVNMAITASFAILGVLFVRFCIRRSPKIFAYLLWSVVAFRLFCPVSFSSFISILNIRLYQNSKNSLSNGTMSYFPEMVLNNVNKSVLPSKGMQTPVSPENLQAAADSATNTFLTPGHVFAVLWVAGVVGLLIYGILSYLRLKNKVADAVLLRDNIYECDKIPSPFVFGIIKPRIYIPFRIGEREQSCILMHEMYHIRRFDYIIKPIAFLLLIVYWFHPLVWVAYYCMCRDMEMSCDEKVLSKMDEALKSEYSLILLSFASNRRFPSAGPLAFGESDAKGRIKNILRFRKPKVWLMVLLGVICLLAFLACAANPRTKETIVSPTDKGLEITEQAKELFANRNPYIGDASADGALIRALGIVDQMGEYTIELGTSKRPYILRINFKDELTEREGFSNDMFYNATVLLALIDNVDEIQWSYPYTEKRKQDQITVYWNEDNLVPYSIENIKGYAVSEEKVQELLNILTDKLGSMKINTEDISQVPEMVSRDNSEKMEEQENKNQESTSNELSMDTVLKISNWGNLKLDYFRSFSNAIYDRFDMTDALNDYITFNLMYEDKAFELRISYMKEDESIDFIELVKQYDMDTFMLKTSDARYKVQVTAENILSFLKKDVKMSDFLTYQLPGKYVDGNFNALLGLQGGNLFLKNGKQPEGNSTSAPVEWYAPGGVLRLPQTPPSEYSASYVTFKDGKLVGGYMGENHTWEISDPIILKNLSEQAVIVAVNHDLYTAAEAEEAKDVGKPIPEKELTSEMYEIYFAREYGKHAYCIFLNKKYFTYDAAIALAKTVRFKDRAFE